MNQVFLFKHKDGPCEYEAFIVIASSPQEATDLVAKALKGDKIVDFDVFVLKPEGEPRIWLSLLK